MGEDVFIITAPDPYNAVYSVSLPNGNYLPTSLLTVDRPFGVVLTVFEVWLQLVQPQCGCTAKGCIVAADLEFGQHVAHDAGHRPEMSKRYYRAVNRTYLLLGEPLSYTSIAKGMLTVWSLKSKREDRKFKIIWNNLLFKCVWFSDRDLPALVLLALHYI